MYKIMMILMVMAILQTCTQHKDTYQIEVKMDQAAGKWIRLMKQEDRNFVVFDSVLATGETTPVLSSSLDGVSTMYLTVEETGGAIRLLMENSHYRISGTVEDPDISTDSKAQLDLLSFEDGKKQITEQISVLYREYRKASAGGDQELLDSIDAVYEALYKQEMEYDSAYIAGHPASFASVLALRGTFYNLDADQLESTLTALEEPLRKMDEYRYMHEKLERMKRVAIGQPYTDFSLKTREGNLLSLSEVHNGNVLLLDFWASWCGPCRKANPELVEIFHDYHDRGLEIVGISLDRDSASWVKAIADDHLNWHHISDLKYWNSKGAVLYGVSSIPHTVLIDRNGIIAAKKLHGDELRAAIESLL